MRILIPILALTFAAVAQEGQEMTSLKGVVLKGKAPVSNEILRVKLPRPIEGKLNNGLQVVVLEDHRAPTIVMDLVIPAAALSDLAAMPGVADATADMMRLGTKTRDSRQIAETLAELGASINTQAGFSSRNAHVRISTLTENLDAVLELLADVLLNPSFPQNELDKWKQRQLSGLQQARAQPSFLAEERMHQVLYEGDARAIIAPTPDSLSKLTRQHLVDFHAAHYSPGGSILGVAGDIKAKDLFARLNKHLAGWKGKAGELPELPLREPIGKRQIILIHRPNSVQTYLLLANRAIDRLSPDYYACMVMNRILGQGPAARLFRNIREEKGYTYGIRSSFNASRSLNHFDVGTSVRTEVTGPAIEEILKEFTDIRQRLVPAAEIDGAKRAIVANFALGLESSSNLLGQVLTQREYGFPADYWDRYPENIMKVTTEEVRKVAAKYVPVDSVQIVAVGDAAKVREELAKFGEVVEFNTEGERSSR
jgi:zinc protease